ncbi:MAG: class I SAM-dependent methyltransferase [Verrucomicrobiota bacterium]
MQKNSTTRFSNRVENYVRYRPGYPDAVVRILQTEAGLTPGAVIADIGSGTGISSALFLKHGFAVIGVEPNREMREAAESLLAGQPDFRSVNGTAEATTLADRSVDFVVAGQAFHWFDVPKTRAEFARILKPGGKVALMWNTRRVDTTPFLRAYEDLLLKFATDYQQVDHRNIDERVLKKFFANGEFTLRKVENEQVFDFAGLRGRLLSSSYAPADGEPGHAPMLAELERIFQVHAKDSRVRFEYDTELYWGGVGADD